MTEPISDNNSSNSTNELPEADNQQQDGNSLREASYVLLFIGAVFVINAMETGSYRTPWPVAIVTALAGIGLFAYSWIKQPHK
jgi:hypothetical protein